MIIKQKIANDFINGQKKECLTKKLCKSDNVTRYRIGYIVQACLDHFCMDTEEFNPISLLNYVEIDKKASKTATSVNIKKDCYDKIQEISAKIGQTIPTTIRLILEAAYDKLKDKSDADITQIKNEGLLKEDDDISKFKKLSNTSEKLDVLYEKLIKIEEMLEKDKLRVDSN